MRRRETTLDPAVVAELEALEAALAGDPSSDPSLDTLVRDVRAEAPTMAPAFRAQLDESVEREFARSTSGARRGRLRGLLLGAAPSGPPRGPSPGRSRRSLLGRRSLVPALGVAGCALAALVAVLLIGRGSSDDLSRPGGGGSVASQAAPAERESSGAAADSASGGGSAGLAAPSTKAAPPTQPASPTGGARRVERTTRLELSTTDVQRVADGVVRATQSVGGFVQLSQVRTGDGQGSASFVLRVPTAKLDDALASLSKLGHVRALEQSADDITGAYDSASARLADARAERRGLLRALGKATTAEQISSLRARITDNRRALQRLQRSFNSVRRRADLATIQVDVVGRARKQAPAPSGGTWTPGDAAHDAVRVLEVSAGVALIALAVLIPLGVLGVAARFAAGAYRRRRREAAISSAI
jgi:Domain of unknown function (DUF4349)